MPYDGKTLANKLFFRLSSCSTMIYVSLAAIVKRPAAVVIAIVSKLLVLGFWGFGIRI